MAENDENDEVTQFLKELSESRKRQDEEFLETMRRIEVNHKISFILGIVAIAAAGAAFGIALYKFLTQC